MTETSMKISEKNQTEQKQAMTDFVERWTGKGYEKGESQRFWLDLLKTLGVENPIDIIEFEDQVHIDKSTGFIDAYIPETKVLVEQKSLNKDLRQAIRQSDGSLLNPFQQAKKYIVELPVSRHPRWVVTCNFQSFLVYDMNNPNGEPEEILLKDLPQEYTRLKFLIDVKDDHIKREEELSFRAGELVGELYDAFSKQYRDITNPQSQKDLNELCVRLVFCLYAEDAGLFGRKNAFHDYLSKYDDLQLMRENLIKLFRILDTPLDQRDPYLDDDLNQFPYVNGGLFSNENIEIPLFTAEIRQVLLAHASDDFNWSEISPTIFGAVFESTLNPETRRAGGMHYTSVENIHKVIDPLFLDDLREYLDAALAYKNERTRTEKLREFQDHMAGLIFFDPACGSGNFLTETYLSLRRLENEALRSISRGRVMLDLGDVIKVSIQQFFGIEINDFAVKVAKTALWIAEAQMWTETQSIVNSRQDITAFLPLESYNNIVEGNALRIDWNEVAPAEKCSYIMGNPPFVGARLMSKEQKVELLTVMGKGWKNAGNLDYVACWYKKAADYMLSTKNVVRAALVSTNSVSQGESVANLWKPLFDAGIHIDFAHRTFRWDSESLMKAHVYCVIIGFSVAPNMTPRRIFDSGRAKTVKNINGYLIDAENIFVESRQQPLCDVPAIGIGNKPIDGGYYLFAESEKDNFIEKEPRAAAYFRPWYGAQEFINQAPRYCLWLGDCSPAELRQMPECMKRIEAVKRYRLASPSAGTRKLADTPTRFHVENMPSCNYIAIPETSSEKRKYIPIGFMSPSVLCSNALKIISNAGLYHFGILTSNVHMAWMRAVGGRLEMRYRYSKDIVYNNFPWPDPTPEQKAKIEATAQDILDARAKYPDSSLADLYDELTMPRELRKAHQENDKAVMQAYGFSIRMTESECVAKLMQMYRNLAKEG